ncbi:MAG: hypothetical protein QMD13_04905 [Candidatus Bathyarchaeia archaeon]|nr:hypothetical protein [Candidatus Bathyarchaeia archaeon]
MSKAILMCILSEIHVRLSEFETEELYRELLAYFGLIGATDECQALENAWKDPYNRCEIEEFIKAWLKRKQRRKGETITEVV